MIYSNSPNGLVIDLWRFVRVCEEVSLFFIILQMDDHRLDCALLRPMESEGEHFLAYYLVKDDDSINDVTAQRAAASLQEEPDPSVR